MREAGVAGILALALGAVAAVAGAASPSAARDLVAPGEIQASVALSSDVGEDGSIHGVLKNTGPQAVRDVRLLIHHTWLWRDERNPGPPQSNPGRTEYYVVEGEIAPGGTLGFHYVPSPPLPARTDGRFVTRAEIVGLVERGF